MAAPRTRTLPRSTPLSWEAEAPTENLPVIVAVPTQRSASDTEPLPAVARPFVAPVVPAAEVAGRFAAGTIVAVLALAIVLALLGGLLELTGAIPR